LPAGEKEMEDYPQLGLIFIAVVEFPGHNTCVAKPTLLVISKRNMLMPAMRWLAK